MLQSFEAADSCHTIVEQHHVRCFSFYRGYPRFATGRFLHKIMLRGKHAVKRVTHLGVIINDKNMGSGERLGHDKIRKVKREYRKAGFIPRGPPFGQLIMGRLRHLAEKLRPRNLEDFALNNTIN